MVQPQMNLTTIPLTTLGGGCGHQTAEQFFKKPAPQTDSSLGDFRKNNPQIVHQVQNPVHQVQKPMQNEMQKIDPSKRYYKCLNLTDQSHKNIADKFKSLAEEFQLTQEQSHKKESHKEILLKFVNLTERGKESIYVNREVKTSPKKLHTTVCSGCSNAECNNTDDCDQNTECIGTFQIWKNDLNIVNNNFSEKKWMLALKLDSNLDGQSNSHVILVRDMPGDIGDPFNSFLQRVGGDAKKVEIEFEKTPIFLESNNDKNQENKKTKQKLRF